jgi:hypothetical protein
MSCSREIHVACHEDAQRLSAIRPRDEKIRSRDPRALAIHAASAREMLRRGSIRVAQKLARHLQPARKEGRSVDIAADHGQAASDAIQSSITEAPSSSMRVEANGGIYASTPSASFVGAAATYIATALSVARLV